MEAHIFTKNGEEIEFRNSVSIEEYDGKVELISDDGVEEFSRAKITYARENLE